MKIHTTNYFNTFIEVADDCQAKAGETPPVKGNNKTIAGVQFKMVKSKPYKFTSDEVIYNSYAIKNDLAKSELEAGKESFFSKGQPCMRASPLTKRYGWGVHYNEEGKMAIYGLETEAYQKFSSDKKLTVLKAMRSKKLS